MQANGSVTPLILVGGLGTRLRSVVSARPKVLAPVTGRPFLSFLLDKILQTEFRHVILCTGYLGAQIRGTYGDRYNGLTIEYSEEPEPMGTAGALRYALHRITTDSVLVMNGDSFVDTDFRSYVDWYCAKKLKASLLLARVPDTRRFGRVEVDKDGRILDFEEKGNHTGQGWVNAGVYIFRRLLLESIPEGKRISLEREVLPDLVCKGLSGYRCSAELIDIGTPESYSMAEQFFSGNSF